MATAPSDTLSPDSSGYELERLSALETLKGLKDPDQVTLGDLVRYLDARGLWTQFAKITLGDLRDGFTEAPPKKTTKRRKKERILEDEFADAYAEKAENEGKAKANAEPKDGGISSDEFARQVVPFIEGNGEVTLDDIEEYTRLDRKVLRHHLGILVKEERLERIGVGRHAIYSSLL
ncbi:MAG: hypothetical protein ACE37F_30405 [Nannocystaceae bacterium]|nr:hypothetical protein [bacterium]